MLAIEIKKQEFPFAFVEEIKQLRTNIEYSGSDNKVIMVTSSVANEGKSTLALEIARSFTELGKRVLFVDADMRNSVMYKKIISTSDSKRPHGLSYFLSGQTAFENVLYRVGDSNLYCILAGRVPPNPSELLANPRLTNLISWARDNFDYIFFDSAPMTLVSDGSVLARQMDSAILVMKCGEVSRKSAQDVVKQLQRADCPIVGVVLNQYKQKLHGSYYRYGEEYGHKPTSRKKK